MRGRILTTAAVLTVLSLTMPAAAVPPEAAGGIGSPNVDFVANVPDPGAVGARIIGDTMYMTTTEGLRIFDVSLGIPVPQGRLELPHFENEYVDTNGDVLLISADWAFGFNMLWVIDVSNKHLPLRLAGPVGMRNGHTITCIQDCDFAWSVGGDNVSVWDLRNPAAPVEVGTFGPGSHHVDVDDTGIAWVSAYGGLWAYDVRPSAYGAANLTSPPLITRCRHSGECTPFLNDFIIHNSLRPVTQPLGDPRYDDAVVDPGEVVYVSEENWLGAPFFGNNVCANDGRFQTGWFRRVGGAYRIDRIDSFSIGQSMPVGDATPGKPAGATCSSHWFDWESGIVANSWYEQGVRFFDVSNPRDIKHVGYFMPATATSFQSIIHPVTAGPLPGLYVYSIDLVRGIDVLRFTGTAGAMAPVEVPFNAAAPPAPAPHPRFGYACRIGTIA